MCVHFGSFRVGLWRQGAFLICLYTNAEDWSSLQAFYISNLPSLGWTQYIYIYIMYIYIYIYIYNKHYICIIYIIYTIRIIYIIYII
jgi:hypothetical protein